MYYVKEFTPKWQDKSLSKQTNKYIDLSNMYTLSMINLRGNLLMSCVRAFSIFQIILIDDIDPYLPTLPSAKNRH